MTPIVLPDDLTELDRWALWREERGAKVPYTVTGRRARSNSPDGFGPYEDAVHALKLGGYSGLAFLFVAEDGLVGIDFDDCLDLNGDPKPWIQPLLEHLSDTYCEYSPSRTGLKLWVRGIVPAAVTPTPVGDGSIELYSNTRFFAVTGHRFRNAPLQVAEHGAFVARLYAKLRPPVPAGNSRAATEARIREGERNGVLYSLARLLVNNRTRRILPEVIIGFIKLVNSKQCDSPLSDGEIQTLVNSALRKGTNGTQP